MAQYTRSDLARVAPRVLARLMAMAPLPSHGTVAGQAVASVFLEELGHRVRGPINDIDVFVSRYLPRTERGLEPLRPVRQDPSGWSLYDPDANPARTIGRVSHAGLLDYQNKSYSHIKFIATRITTRILRTYQSGLLNYTLIDHPSMNEGDRGYGPEVAREIIDGFDINAVGVGIHLDSGQVVASDAFLEFLGSARLKVVTCNTPAHSLIRLAKKFHGGELPGASCDWEGERRMLEMAIACQKAQEEGPYILEFGSRYKALHERFCRWLPTLSSRPGRTGKGKAPYPIHRLEIREPDNDADAAFLALAREGTDSDGPGAGEPLVTAYMVYAAHFPRIYDLLHPERSTLAPGELRKRQAALAQWRPGTRPEEQIRHVFDALGMPRARVAMEPMDEAQTLRFFQGQEQGRDDGAIKAMIERWNAWSELERRVATFLKLRADEVARLMDDPGVAWPRLMGTPGVVEQIVSCLERMPDGDADADAMDRERERFCERMLAWAQEGHARLRQTLAPVLLAEDPKTIVPWSSKPLAQLLSCFPAHRRPRVATQALRWAIADWPRLAGTDPRVATSALRGWAALGFPIPDAALQSLSKATCKRIVVALGARGGPSMEEESIGGLLLAALSILGPGAVAANQGRLLRAALKAAPEQVLAWLGTPAGREFGPAVDRALRLLENTEAKSRRQQAFDRRWKRARTLPGMDPLFSDIPMLDAHVWVEFPDTTMARLRENSLARRLAGTQAPPGPGRLRM